MSGYGRENDERRKVDRDSIAKRIPNEDQYVPLPGEPPWEPDYEDIAERRAERRRPDWDSDLRRF